MSTANVTPSNAPPIPDQPGRTEADPNQTIRMIAMIGVIVCAGMQAVTTQLGGEFVLVAVAGLVAWFLLANHITPVYLLFFGNLLLRLATISNWPRTAYRDGNPGDFLSNLFDSVTFVGLMAFAFIYYELAPKRLDPGWEERSDQPKKKWHMFEPYSGLLVRLPIAVTLAMIVYFLSQQLRSPIDPRILKEQFAQTYLLCCILFAAYLLVKTILDIWAWRKLSPGQALFFVKSQQSLEARDELDLVQKPAWSRMDHASAVGGMFFLQWLASGILAAIMVFNARISGSELFMWPAVAALFVFLTGLYNALRTARSNVSAENHVIALVSFIVVLVIGLQSLQLADWPWKILYYSWWCFNAAIIIRMSYLWLLDESFARKNNWERAKPFSIVRFLIVLLEGLFGLFILYIVSVEMINMFWYPRI